MWVNIFYNQHGFRDNFAFMNQPRVALQTNFKFGWFQNVWKNQIARPEMKLINKIYSRISVLVKCKRQSHRGNFSGKNCLQSRNLKFLLTYLLTCHAAEWGNLHFDCIVVVTRHSASANPVVWVILMTKRWLNEHNRLLLAAALLCEQNRRRRRVRRAPYAWRLPSVNGSWFEIHYNERAIPETFFRQQLRMNRATFDTVVNILKALEL